MHPIPKSALELKRRGQWPQGRIPMRLLIATPPLSECDFELLPFSQILDQDRSQCPDLNTLLEFADNSRLATLHRLYRGVNNNGPSDLPWLDVDRITVIGGGADYGDDVWLVLDYRRSANEPLAVVNEWRREDPLDERSRATTFWVEAAPTFSAFLEKIPRIRVIVESTRSRG